MDQSFSIIRKNKLFFKFINSRTSNDLIVFQYGYEDFKGKISDQVPHKRQNFLVHYVQKGEGIVEVEKKVFKARQGDIFILQPNTRIFYYPDHDNPWTYFWVDFNGLKASYFFQRAEFSNDSPVYSCKNPDSIQKAMMSILESRFYGEGIEEIVSLSGLYKLFALLIHERNPEIPDISKKKEKYVYEALAYIQENYQNSDLDLNTIANHLYLHPAYLSRIFAETASTTVSKQIITVRLQKAANLLENSGKSIKEISNLVGYSNPFYFSKEFKRHYNINPSKYALIKTKL